MKKLRLLIYVLCLLLCNMTVANAATKQPMSRDYIEKYFTAVAAASCMGIYLPETSAEFNYLRSYGWDIMPYTQSDGKTETNFAIASNYFEDLKKEVYLVTFRGTDSKKDWGINLKTKKVQYGGTTLTEMKALADTQAQEKTPGVHKGFNDYVNTVLEMSIVDANSNLTGIFQEAKQRDDVFLVLTGHSLGGAVATLLGERLVQLGLPKEKFCVITFGAPAIGSEEFADEYGEAIDLVRVTNSADPIPGSLQTFFSGYKQFGKHVKYSLAARLNTIQHDMAMYFDYSLAEYYNEFDRQVSLDRLRPVPDERTTEGVPKVAFFVRSADHVKRIAGVTDIKRLTVDSYKRMAPSYQVMQRDVAANAYQKHDLVQIGRDAGAEYILLCGVSGEQPRDQKYWFLTVEQAVFDKDGRMVTMGSYAKKVSPSVGNVQALGEALNEARVDLQQHLPFLKLTTKATLRLD